MNNQEKSNLTRIGRIDAFSEAMKKLSTNEQLTIEEQSYLLSCAIIFLRRYEEDGISTSYLEFAYYIILKYSLMYEDYLPLYQFSVNFGYFPIARAIAEIGLFDNKIENIFIDRYITNKYGKNDYIQTKEQFDAINHILKKDFKEASYIAPTSYGKSEIIVKYIEKYIENYKKIAIIVPTKSLLAQTYKLVRKQNFGSKVIIYDDMYNGEEKCIAVFTQERALRMLENHSIVFDLLFIDEAHNLLKFEQRSILLSRLIRRAKLANQDTNIVYLSPLIQNSNNLKVNERQKIDEIKVRFNIKEFEIYEYRLNKEVYFYNRFLNQFYFLKTTGSYLKYISENSGNKNFIYIRSPRKIETFTDYLYECFDGKEEEIPEEISKFKNILRGIVHEDFYGIDFLDCGIIYLHGKLPEILKEYIESKYSEYESIKYIVANSVILEGINLPIDTLFILNTYSLGQKELTNLIGRVNRLNTIFSKDGYRLDRLLPQIHFVNTEAFNRENSKMESKIKSLRSNIYKDIVVNPVLDNFDIEELKKKRTNKEDKDKIVAKANNTKNREEFILKNVDNEVEGTKQYIINNSIDEYYNDINQFAERLNKRINNIKGKIESKRTVYLKWNELKLLEKVYYVFIREMDISDFEVDRLQDKETRNYYEMHIINSFKNDLPTNVNIVYNYFNKIINDEERNNLYFVGESYGEIAKPTKKYPNSHFKVYIDLSKKTKKELINIIIVKLKMEDDFVSFKLNKFIVMLHDYGLITDDEYNKYTYGTTDKEKIKIIKSGLSTNIISRLEKDNQFKNLYIDEYGNIQANEELERYKDSTDDYFKFQLNRIL